MLANPIDANAQHPPTRAEYDRAAAPAGETLAGVPTNGKPFPDGSKMAKTPKKLETFPTATVPGMEHDVDFMVKDN